MDMRTDLTAVPHASLRNPNPEEQQVRPEGVPSEYQPHLQPSSLGNQRQSGIAPLLIESL